MKKLFSVLALVIALSCFVSVFAVSAAEEKKLTNVAFAKPVTESGHEWESTSWNCKYLTDGIKMFDDEADASNGWYVGTAEKVPAEADRPWVYIDLRGTYTVEEVAIYPRETGEWFPVAYEFQVSKDATNWTTVKEVTGDDGNVETIRKFAITPVEASYVRVIVTESGNVNAGKYLSQFSEVEVYAVDPKLANMELVSVGKPVVEKGHANESENWNKDHVTNGTKFFKGWCSDAGDADAETWIYVDLEEVKNVSAVGVYPRKSEIFFPVDYKIQVSKDAENWTTVKEVTGDDGKMLTDHLFVVDATEGRYVRVLVTKRYSAEQAYDGCIAQISEIEVFAKTASDEPVTPPSTEDPVTPPPTGDMSMSIVIAAAFVALTVASKKKIFA